MNSSVNILWIILLVFGVVLVFLLMLVAYTVWRYFRLKKGKTDYQYSLIQGEKVPPMSCCTLEAQLPPEHKNNDHLLRRRPSSFTFGISDEHNENEENTRNASLSEDKTKSRSGSLRIGEQATGQTSSINRYMYSIASLDEDSSPILTDINNRQQRIIDGAIEHLKRQGRKVSASDLRSYSKPRSLSLGNQPASTNKWGINSLEEKVMERKKPHALTHQERFGSYNQTEKSYRKAGKIAFTTRYLEEQKSFEIHILRASDLAPKCDVSNINLFVCVYLEPGKRQKHKTRCHKGTREPNIDEKVIFSNLNKNEVIKYMLKIKVYKQEKFKKKEILGEVGIALSTLDLSAKETYHTDLVVEKNKTVTAFIKVSLCHKATASKLEVIVQEGIQMQKSGVTGAQNTYATALLFNEESMCRKEAGKKRKKTHFVLNESMEFDVSADFANPLSTFSLVVTLNHKSIVGKDEIIGHVIFGNLSPQESASNHWKLVQDLPHKSHAAWHALKIPDDLNNL